MVTEEGASYNKNIVNDATQLYHLRIDISAFSAAVNGNGDKPLNESVLYCPQFADGGLWNSALKANIIGSTEYIEKVQK